MAEVNHMSPGFLTPVLTQLFFPSHRLLFSHASAEVRGENNPERKVASTGDRTHNHQVMSPTRSPLSHPGGATTLQKKALENAVGKGENAGNQHFLLFPLCFLLSYREKSSYQQCLICWLQMLLIWPCQKLCCLVKR